MCGAVDGITDTPVPVGDDWGLQRVVVELKNRISKLSVPPPFYDELQLVTCGLVLRRHVTQLA